MMTTDEFVHLAREQQRDHYASLDDTERRALWEQLDADGHRFLYDRAARDHQILTTGATMGHPLHGQYLELVEDFRKTREHAAEIERRRAAGSTEYGKGSE